MRNLLLITTTALLCSACSAKPPTVDGWVVTANTPKGEKFIIGQYKEEIYQPVIMFFDPANSKARIAEFMKKSGADKNWPGMKIEPATITITSVEKPKQGGSNGSTQKSSTGRDS